MCFFCSVCSVPPPLWTASLAAVGESWDCYKTRERKLEFGDIGKEETYKGNGKQIGKIDAGFGKLKQASHLTEIWVLLLLKPMEKGWLISGVGRLSQNSLLLYIICMEVNHLYLQVHLSLWRWALSLVPHWCPSLFQTAFPRLYGRTHFSSLQKPSRLVTAMCFSLFYYSTCMEIC